MNPLDFQSILDQCIGRIQAGESINRCLADYPEMADELSPLLALSSDLVEIEPLTSTSQAVSAGRDAMFAAFDEVEEASNVGLIQLGLFGWLRETLSGSADSFSAAPQLSLVGRMAIVIIGVFASAGVVANSSASSLPGDQLYPVKRLIEDTRLTLSASAEGRSDYQKFLAQRRRDEVEALQQAGRAAEVEFGGVIEEITAEGWVINGIEVKPLPELTGDQEPAVGESVTVTSQVDPDGVITVNGVEIEQANSERPVEIVPTSSPTANPTQTPTPTLLPTQVPVIDTVAPTRAAATATPIPANTPEPVLSPTATTVPAEATATPPIDATRPAENDRATREALATQQAENQATRAAQATEASANQATRSANATAQANHQATQVAEATAAANERATRAAQATQAANDQATRDANGQATREAMATEAANNQATRDAKATEAANNQATRDAKATEAANNQATRDAKATEAANNQATRDARATEAAKQQATRQAHATKQAEATRDAPPTATPKPAASPTPTQGPEATRERDQPPTPTPERDG